MRNKYNIKFEDSLDSVSAHDCTGLIPAAPTDEDALDVYRDIYDFGLPPHKAYRREKAFRNDNIKKN